MGIALNGSLKLSQELEARIRAHAGETYPHECCGALLGRDGDEGREVLALVPLENRRDDSPRNRFSIAPEDVLLAEQKAREQRIDLIGWYHSHPDHPAAPSEFDREHAWPWYSYIIVRSESQRTKEMNCWRLADDRASYTNEPIEASAPVAAQRER
jgi:proteasome lid subunit RPN8/RPN11